MLNIQCFKILTSANITSICANMWKIILLGIEITHVGSDISRE